MPARIRHRLLILLLVPFLLSACGNRGDLYLPPEEPPPAETPKPEPAEPPKADE
ncbi:MAG: hypothetical protein KatS3mg125_0077 [Lysobacterales bacterium]|jgi:predicted small lipoprotein YifL|nr:MAG: hypothetical protein KatS3mg125_0077 [Xanthomonadales bacterium]